MKILATGLNCTMYNNILAGLFPHPRRAFLCPNHTKRKHTHIHSTFVCITMMMNCYRLTRLNYLNELVPYNIHHHYYYAELLLKLIRLNSEHYIYSYNCRHIYSHKVATIKPFTMSIILFQKPLTYLCLCKLPGIIL